MISIRHHTVTAKQLWLFVLAALLLLVIARVVTQTVHAASNESRSGRHVLTVHDSGQEYGVLTEANTLREALKEAEVELAANDITEPALDDELVAASYEVNIYRSRPVTVVDGENQTKVMTPYQTPKQIAKQAGITLADEDKITMRQNNDVLVAGALEQMIIDRAMEVTFIFYGKKIPVHTHAATVGEMLAEREIELGKNDTLSVKTSTKLKEGMTIELWREGKQTVTRDEAVDFPVQQIQDADRPIGYKQVKTPGKKGEKTVTYEIIMKNGKEVSKKAIKTVVTKQPVKQVEVVGTKSNFKYTGGPLSDKQINALGMCESGMNPTTNTGNGFYGAFQFMSSTWSNVAPAPYNGVLPHQAPLDAQKQAVQNLLSGSSIFTQFPGCASKMRAQGII